MLHQEAKPLAIAMWDFSWLERRWPGAGYENWDRALDELTERGYDALRIDAYPHLLAEDPARCWELLPEWSTNDWGSPGRNRVRVQPALEEFLGKCAARGIRVELSTWFRQDVANTRMRIGSGQRHGEIWVETLAQIGRAGLLDTICAVDLCNEWPASPWAPFFPHPVQSVASGLPNWQTPQSIDWMREALGIVRAAYPSLPLTFSLWPFRDTKAGDLDFLDFLDAHLWVPCENDINQRMGYGFERFDLKGYDNLALNAEKLYRAEEKQWQDILRELIEWNAAVSERIDRPLVTTECWAITDYKDWPLLDWGWIKELCAIGTETASATGRWAAIATSNFCGPQFRGMWRDIAWHQRLTSIIKAGKMPRPSLR